MSVQNRAFDWESLTILMDGFPIANAKSVDWSDTYGVTPVYGAGGAPIAWGRRNYRAQGSMEIADADYAAFHSRLSAFGGIYQADFNLLLKYGNNSIARGYSAGHSVHLKGCKLSRRGGASRQGAAEARIVRLEYEILNGVMEFNTNVLDFIR